MKLRLSIVFLVCVALAAPVRAQQLSPSGAGATSWLDPGNLARPPGSGTGTGVGLIVAGSASITVTNGAGPIATVTLTMPGGTCASHNFGVSLSSDGTFACQQPAFTDISGTCLATQGCTGLASPTAHDLLITNGSSNYTLLSMAADTFVQGNGASVDPSAGALPNCSNDGSHALIYSTSTHTFTCQAITTGTVTGGTNSCSAGFVQTGTTISSTGVPTAVCTQKTDKFTCGITAVGTNSQILCDIPMTIAETVPVNCTASTATAVTAATGSTTYTIKKITSGGSSTTIGTVVFSASGKTGAFTCSSPVSLASTDLLEIDGPATADATLAQMGISISANAGAL